MRIGENPTKFFRHNPELGSLNVKIPSKITFTTITFIPELIGYYEDSFNVLKLVFNSILKNTPFKFDLIVFDNGSCDEVIDYLLQLKKSKKIDQLILSSANQKKLGAWNTLFSGALGDLVYYFDSDIYHYPEWYHESLKILEEYPEAGVVCSCPVINRKYLENNISYCNSENNIHLEEGYFIDENWIRELAMSLGTDPNNFLKKKLIQKQIRITRNKVQAYVASWHPQFFVRSEVLRKMFPKSRSWALDNTDKSFDQEVDELGYLKLSATKPGIYHLGNSINGKWNKCLSEIDPDSMERNEKSISCASWIKEKLNEPNGMKELRQQYAELFQWISS